ncbi:MAG TPA: DUF2239 family protein [Polyangiaceae bacterium]|jgi:hypothetical protein|nr:DUF2239 family protein [Polyangiaceae bacterium]
MEVDTNYVAFARARQIALGPLSDVLAALKQRFDRDDTELVLVFEVESGRQVDFDLRGSLEEVLARALPTAARGPGRPKLGVASREVSLFPKHWEWLETQPAGISGTLRRLVEHAIKHEPAEARAKQARSALSRILSSIAGNRPHYEEASRALFSGDDKKFAELVADWPKDIRQFAIERVRAASDLLDA